MQCISSVVTENDLLQMSSCHASNVVSKSGSLHQVLNCWTAASKRCVLDPQMDRKTEIAAEITKNSCISFLFHKQNFPDPKLMFCVKVSHVICKIWGNFLGIIGSNFMCYS